MRSSPEMVAGRPGEWMSRPNVVVVAEEPGDAADEQCWRVGNVVDEEELGPAVDDAA